MNYKKLNILSNIYFVFLISIGAVYSIFLIKLFIDTAPGFVMFLIYIVDILKHGHSVLKIDSLNLLLVTSLISILTQFLIYKFLKAILLLYKKITDTNDYINKLKTTKSANGFLTVKTNSTKPFTAGLFKPHIFLPEKLHKTLSKDEINAIVLHEQQHCKSLDPLKSLIISFTGQYLPTFPFKNWVFGYFAVLSELTADSYAENVLHKKLPIISALYKQSLVQDIKYVSAVGFSSQSERIHILVGNKKINLKSPMLILFVVAATLITGTLLMEDKHVFYSCEHLSSCAETVFFSNDSLINIHQ